MPRGFAFQAFSDRNYGGEAGPVIRGRGIVELGFDAKSYVWVRNGLHCCLTLCRQSSRSACDDLRETDVGELFDRVYIWCPPDNKKDNQRCYLDDE